VKYKKCIIDVFSLHVNLKGFDGKEIKKQISKEEYRSMKPHTYKSIVRLKNVYAHRHLLIRTVRTRKVNKDVLNLTLTWCDELVEGLVER
jgi:hypothetical protein